MNAILQYIKYQDRPNQHHNVPIHVFWHQGKATLKKQTKKILKITESASTNCGILCNSWENSKRAM